MPHSTFDELAATMATGGVKAVLDALVSRLRAEKKYHELFDALLMRSRHELGVAVILMTPLEEVPEPLRSKLEDSYLEACREVGALLVEAGQLRAAWMYLRPVGDKSLIAAALERGQHDSESLQEVIEIALHEGVDPALGYRLVLENYGTCNAITTFEGAMGGRPLAERQAAAEMLLEHVHRELVSNVRSDIARREGTAPTADRLSELIAGRTWLFEDNNYHIDTTHLAATVRLARILEDHGNVELALDLVRYGRGLSQQFQFAGEEPFVDLYPSHELFFEAQLGERIEEAIEYFRKRAAEVDPHEYGTLPAETLVVLLVRTGRYSEATDAAASLLPPGTRTSGFSPSLLELARMAGNYGRALEVCKERGDLIGFTVSLIESRAKGATGG